MRRSHQTRAIEPIIAALLLIAIAVAASVMVYSWIMGMISSQSEQAGTSIRIDLVEFKVGTEAKPLTLPTTLQTDLVLGRTGTLTSGSTLKAASTLRLSSDFTIDLASHDDLEMKAGSTLLIESGSIIRENSKIAGTVFTGTDSLSINGVVFTYAIWPPKTWTNLVDDLSTTASQDNRIKDESTLKANSQLTLASDETIDANLVLKADSTIKVGSTLAAGSSVTSDKIEVTIRNSGLVYTTITTVYVKTPEGNQWVQTWTSDNVIDRGQTKKLTFTTLNTVSGSFGAVVNELANIPFSWKTSSNYIIKVVTSIGFITESPYGSPATHA